MKYIALLRGINVGGNNKIDTRKLKEIFIGLNFKNISTYLNTGNIIFDCKNSSTDMLETEIEKAIKQEFNLNIPTLVKTDQEIKNIANSIPSEWKYDIEQQTYIGYLFSKVDFENIVNELPVKKEFIDLRYVKGAVFWNVKRENYNKSQINKIVNHNYYKYMTIRNINTARYLAGIKQKTSHTNNNHS